MKKTLCLSFIILLFISIWNSTWIYLQQWFFWNGDTNISILEKLGSPNRIYYEAFEQNSNFDLISYEYKDENGNLTVFSFYRGSEVIVLINTDSDFAGIKTETSMILCGKMTKADIEKKIGKGILVCVKSDDTLVYEYSFTNKLYPSFPIEYQFFYKNSILSGIVVNFINFWMIKKSLPPPKIPCINYLYARKDFTKSNQ